MFSETLVWSIIFESSGFPLGRIFSLYQHIKEEKKNHGHREEFTLTTPAQVGDFLGMFFRPVLFRVKRIEEPQGLAKNREIFFGREDRGNGPRKN